MFLTVEVTKHLVYLVEEMLVLVVVQPEIQEYYIFKIMMQILLVLQVLQVRARALRRAADPGRPTRPSGPGAPLVHPRGPRRRARRRAAAHPHRGRRGHPLRATGGPLELLSTDSSGIAAGGYAPSTSADGRTVAFLSDGNLQMHLAEKDLGLSYRAGKAVNPVERGHLAFRTDDIEAFKRHLEERGIPYSDYKGVATGTWHQIFFHDPEGNVVEVHQVLEG